MCSNVRQCSSENTWRTSIQRHRHGRITNYGLQTPCDLKVRRYYPREEEYILEGRDFINGLKPGYRPLAYPHPLVAADAPHINLPEK